MVINMTHSECYAALALKFIASLEEIDPVIRGFSGQFFMATTRDEATSISLSTHFLELRYWIWERFRLNLKKPSALQLMCLRQAIYRLILGTRCSVKPCRYECQHTLNIVVIGEAATKLIDHDPTFAAQHPPMPWQKIRGMRNRLALCLGLLRMAHRKNQGRLSRCANA